MRSSKAEGGGRLALAGAGVDDQQALLDRLVGDLGVLHGLALGHLGAVALGLGLDRRSLLMRCPFTNIGSPATSSTTRSARAAIRWLSRPCSIAEAPRQRIVRHDAGADLVGDQQPSGAWRASSAASRRCVSASMSRFGEHEIGQPQRQAIDQNCACRAARRQSPRQDRAAPRRSASSAAAAAMLGDALAHLVVDRPAPSRRRSRAPAALDQPLRIAALAGARAAEEHSKISRGASPSRRAHAKPIDRVRIDNDPYQARLTVPRKGIERECGAGLESVPTPRLPPQL